MRRLQPRQTESINANVCTCTSMQRSLTEHIWHIWSSQRLYEAHPNHSSQPGPLLSYDNKNRSVGTGYRIDIGRAETVAGTKLPSAQKQRCCATIQGKDCRCGVLPSVKRRPRECDNVHRHSKFCGFCHAQHMRNMHAT